jgi:hypothetical protein
MIRVTYHFLFALSLMMLMMPLQSRADNLKKPTPQEPEMYDLGVYYLPPIQESNVAPVANSSGSEYFPGKRFSLRPINNRTLGLFNNEDVKIQEIPLLDADYHIDHGRPDAATSSIIYPTLGIINIYKRPTADFPTLEFWAKRLITKTPCNGLFH